MDFDLDPGTYDVYVAFDLLNREGGWVHRMSGFLTDVPVEAARRTRLDGTINYGAGVQRQGERENSTPEPDVHPPGGARPLRAAAWPRPSCPCSRLLSFP